MQDFNILITKAKVHSISFEIDDDKKLKWNVGVSLCTDENRIVTQCNLSSGAWSEESKIKLPTSVEPLMRRLFEIATPICADKIMNRFIQIENSETGGTVA